MDTKELISYPDCVSKVETIYDLEDNHVETRETIHGKLNAAIRAVIITPANNPEAMLVSIETANNLGGFDNFVTAAADPNNLHFGKNTIMGCSAALSNFSDLPALCRTRLFTAVLDITGA